MIVSGGHSGPRRYDRLRAATMTASVAAAALLAAACSSSSGGSPAPSPSPSQSSSASASPAGGSPAPSRPAGAGAAFSPLTGGKGVFMGEATPLNLKGAGYVQDEYAAAGTATAYRLAKPETGDGRWDFTPGTNASYKTRVLVRRPAKASAFSGTVIVEWLNVSGGVDADPEWSSLNEEITRRGDIWVGVSAQLIGVQGGPVAVGISGVAGAGDVGKGLVKIDPARYGSLHHPGDGYAFDIYSQVARAVRAGAGLAGAHPKTLIAAGESQSAFAMTTYYNGVQPLTQEFDGFFVHSRGAAGLPLAAPGKGADIAGSLSGTPTTFRTDQAAKIMDVQTETDVLSILGSVKARQPDNPTFRLWEVTGTAHADLHLVGASTAKVVKCGAPINNGDLHLVAKSAYHALKTWLTAGTVPITAPRIELSSTSPAKAKRDADGIALGGIRTPPVTVPTAVPSGLPGPSSSVICLLLGSEKPLPAARLARLYPTRQAYQQKYDAAADATIKAGWVLPEDRAALLGYADPGALTA